MVNFFRLGKVLILFILVIVTDLSQGIAEISLKTKMRTAYEAFKKLQPYLANEKAFRLDDNDEQIYELLRSLRDNFHTIDALDSKYLKTPGFKENLRIIDEIVDDSSRRFKEGVKLYSRWQLRGISNNCVSCHIAHNAPLKFDDVENEIGELNSFEKGEFYLATRQFSKARQSYFETIKNSDLRSLHTFALRKWLVASMKLRVTPQEIRGNLLQISETTPLLESDKGDIRSWLGNVDRWIKERPAKVSSFKQAEQLITFALAGRPRNDRINRIDLLRGTEILHTLIENKNLAPELRRKSLLLLGLGYLELGLFFIDELPDIYLRLCINENPGSDDAKQAYNAYREKILGSYTGTGGLDLPADINEDLKELYNKAYNIPYFVGRRRVQGTTTQQKSMAFLFKPF